MTTPEQRRITCPYWLDHKFKPNGSHRVPCHGSYYQGMPKEPDGSIEYQDYVCELCGQTYSEERLYSWEPIYFCFYPPKGRTYSATSPDLRLAIVEAFLKMKGIE